MSAFPPQPPAPPQAPSFTLHTRQKTKGLPTLVGIVISLGAMFLVWSCGKGMYHNYRLTNTAVDQFHQELNQADYETIWGDATDEFRRSGSKEDEIKFFQNVHEKMGNAGKRSAQGFHVNWNNGHLWVNEVFETEFALGKAQEGFVWLVDNEQPKLSHYNVDSPNLR